MASSLKRIKNISYYLDQLYKNPSTQANSIEGLYKNAINTKNNVDGFDITKDEVRRYLFQQPAYQKIQPIPKLRQEKKTVVIGRNIKWQMDLITMSSYSSNNDGYHYLFTIIDVFSKYAFVFPIQTKEAMEVANILEILFENGIKPKILLSDNGSEFKNAIVKHTCQRYQVYQITNFPYTPLGIIERFNKTIKNKLFAFMNIAKTMRYIDVLQLLVQNYNHTIHSTIKQKPMYVHLCDMKQKHCKLVNEQVYNQLKFIDEKHNANILNYINVLERDDSVRIVSYLNPRLKAKDQFKLYKQFHKIKNPNWTEEIFKVSQVFHDGYIIKYKVVDRDGKEYQRKYYHHQLLLINV